MLTRIFIYRNWGAAIIGIALCSGCASTDSIEAPANVQVAVKPTSKPIQKPTVKPTQTKAEKRSEARKLAKAEARAKANAAYDVPSLIGKKIEQVHATLGPLEDPDLEQNDDDDGKMSWANRKGGLLVDYDVSTRQVTGFFVNHQYGEALPKDKLLEMGKLRENDPRYTLNFVISPGDTTKWMGVEVKPN